MEMKNMFTTGNAITLAAFLVGGAIAWGTLSAELGHAQAGMAKLEKRIDTLEQSVSGMSVQSARNEERLLNILAYVQRIDGKLTAQELRDAEKKP